MAIMITGGTGFLGAYLARHLVQEKGCSDLVLFDRFPDESRIEEIVDQVHVVRGDVLEPQEILEALDRYDVDRIVHLAFLTGNAREGKVIPYLRMQCMGTANVFDAARIHGIKRVCSASSVAVYGAPVDRSLTEEDPARPVGLYGVSKLWSEGVAETYNGEYGMEIISLRVCASLGLGRLGRASHASGLIPPEEQAHFMAYPELAALGQPVTMPPDDQITDFIYAADGAEVWWLALEVERPKHFVFNMRAEQRPVGDMTRHLRRLLPEAEIRVGTQPGLMMQLMDNTRLVSELGFEPRYSLETGLEDYVNRVRHRAGLPPVTPA
jgi:nucleoside-diphosphate-sugar epimerase